MIHRRSVFFYPSTISESMLENLRRLTRKNIVLPGIVTVQDSNKGTFLTKMFSRYINNISKQGACILLSEVMDGSFHIFHSTRENESLILLREITVPPDDKTFTLNATPVWFDLLQDGKRREFKIGVEFSPAAKEQQMKDLQSIFSL